MRAILKDCVGQLGDAEFRVADASRNGSDDAVAIRSIFFRQEGRHVGLRYNISVIGR